MKRLDEIGLTEIAEILGCCRQTAYLRVRTGDIAGGRMVGGHMWVAPRAAVLAFKRRSKSGRAASTGERQTTA